MQTSVVCIWWCKVDNILLASGPDKVRVRWVKGHATMQQVSDGATTELDVWGNGLVAQCAARRCNELPIQYAHAWTG